MKGCFDDFFSYSLKVRRVGEKTEKLVSSVCRFVSLQWLLFAGLFHYNGLQIFKVASSKSEIASAKNKHQVTLYLKHAKIKEQPQNKKITSVFLAYIAYFLILFSKVHILLFLIKKTRTDAVAWFVHTASERQYTAAGREVQVPWSGIHDRRKAERGD